MNWKQKCCRGQDGVTHTKQSLCQAMAQGAKDIATNQISQRPAPADDALRIDNQQKQRRSAKAQD